MTNLSSPWAPPVVRPPVARTKGTVGLWLGALLILFGTVAGAALVLHGARQFSDSFADMQRVPGASGGAVSIDQRGTYRIFLERRGPSGGDGATFTPPSPQITVVDPAGATVAIVADRVSETYTYDDRQGRKVGKFRADRIGTYRVRVVSVDGGGALTTVAIARRGPTSALAPILGGVFGGLVLVVAGAVVLIVSAVRRSRSRRAPYGVAGFAPAGAPMAGWAPPPPPPGPAGWAVPPAGGGAAGWAPPRTAGPAASGWTSPAPSGWAPPPDARWPAPSAAPSRTPHGTTPAGSPTGEGPGPGPPAPGDWQPPS